MLIQLLIVCTAAVHVNTVVNGVHCYSACEYSCKWCTLLQCMLVQLLVVCTAAVHVNTVVSGVHCCSAC